MKMKNYFLLLFLPMAAAFSSASFAMEAAAQYQQYQVLDFDWDRDMADIYPIWQQEWDKLFAGSPYNPEIVTKWMKPKTDQSVEIKKTKVLRHIARTIAFANYYKRHATNDVYMDTGAVVKEYQHQGIGKHFLPAIIADAKAMATQAVLVDVKKDNEPMLKLCERYGFKVTGSTLRDQAWALTLKLE